MQGKDIKFFMQQRRCLPAPATEFNPLATEFFFQILAHPVFKM
jgi:hypothetical protein